jgi:dienelactone hydrolase
MPETSLASAVHRPTAELPRSSVGLRYRLFSLLTQPWALAVSLRLFSANAMGAGGRARWQTAGVPAADLDRLLPQIRSLSDWWSKWQALAAGREAEARNALAAGRRAEATAKFLQAFALYDISALGLFIQPERWQAVTRCMAECYAQAAPYLDPPAQRVEIPYGGICLAAYLRMPAISRVPSKRNVIPSVILVNGAGTVKEEMRSMEQHFLARGMATLSVDGPGMGESWSRMGWQYEQEHVAEAALRFLAAVPQLDPARVGLFGISLGGLSVLRMAAHLHSFRAVAAVCPPYDGPAYYDVVPFFVREAIRHMTRLDSTTLHAEMPRTSLRGQIRQIRCPLLVVGAGNDMVVPGNDARLIVREATCASELIWYADDHHCALNHLGEWSGRVAEWMAARLEAARMEPVPVVGA